jgi:hypothetical protein
MDPNETWKNLLLALREGDAVTAEKEAAELAGWVWNGHTPKGLQQAILALEVSE